LKTQLENFSQATQKQIEEAVRSDFDRQKLNSRVTELQSERDLLKDELSTLNSKHSALLATNSRLVEQLKSLEQESFEIQARIRRGIEVERENENISRSVEQQREREREQARVIEEVRGTVRAKDLEIDRMQAKIESAQLLHRQLEAEMMQLRNENARMLENMNAMKTQEVRGESRKNQYELEIMDIKRDRQQMRYELARSQAENAQVRKELEEEINKSKQYQQQIERLRALVDNLDHTKEELVRRLQSTSHEKQSEEHATAVLS